MIIRLTRTDSKVNLTIPQVKFVPKSSMHGKVHCTPAHLSGMQIATSMFMQPFM